MNDVEKGGLSMNCGEVNGLLDRLMDGELSDEEREAMEAHGQTCPACAEAIRSALQLKALFDEMEPEVDVPLQAQAKWRGAVREVAKAQRRKRLTRWVATAAAAVVALVGVGLALNLRGMPRQDAAVTLTTAREAAPQVAGEVMAAGSALQSNAMPDLGDAIEEVADYDVAEAAVVEADGAEEALDEEAPEEGFVELYEAKSDAVCAAVAQRAPACELSLRVEDVETACARIRDLVEEYEGEADVQALEDGGANVYVEIATEDAEAFLSAVMPMDESGEDQPLPELTDVGTVLMLLTVKP